MVSIHVKLPNDYSDCPECGNQGFGVNKGILVCTECGHPSRVDELE